MGRFEAAGRLKINGEVPVVLALFVFGVVYVVAARHYRAMPLTDPGPGLLPIVFGIGLAASCLLGLLRLRRPDLATRPQAQVDDISEDAEVALGWSGALRPLAIIVVLLAFPYVAPHAGYLATSWLVFVLSAQILRRGHILATLLTATGVVAASYLVFVQWLNLPLPTGLVGF
ncbi:tripartite tricarboxylate transporter TctB family protein [Phytohabitans suffuscus]|uniref:DUF1468 domain-containing protein n=1 Tax=Phytohabitans suffuscus TaxID=624315 RepID=A0A6F8YR11_9ACTN|nr:tripartite tricarboxylate transporter TctB family protein [Phytohabitans suffuscus]BCB88587.1 hypothetical protein Psuf_059000 [Phytohabitans suffuscus]